MDVFLLYLATVRYYLFVFGILILTLPFCFAQDWFPFEVIKEYLNDTGPATIIQPPLDTTAQAGFVILMVCRAQGNPKPKVNFRINGKTQDSVSHGKMIHKFDYGAALRIRVRLNNNENRVECVAENHLGTDMKSATIRVLDSNAQPPDGFPQILTGPVDALMQIGKKVTLKCEVLADPKADVTWIKNSVTPIEIDNKHYSTVGSGSLVIHNVRERDNGNYECMARNIRGTVISQGANLQIRNNPMTPQFINVPSMIEVSVSQGANLTCSADGYPIPRVWWAVQIGRDTGKDKKSEHRDLTPRKESSANIIITDITESATYICFASNDLGVVRKKVKIIVKRKPQKPHSVTSRMIGSTYAIIEWKPVTTQPSIDSYTILVRDKSADADSRLQSRQIVNVFPTNLRTNRSSGKVYYNVTDLRPYTEYEVQVFAVINNIGKSDPSSPSIFKTTELPPSTAPIDVQAKATGKTSVLVEWSPPTESNGRITGYKVFHSRKMEAPLSMWTVFRTEKTKFYLSHLVPNATYYVKVNAFNNAGDGPISDAFPILVYPGVPPVPQNFRAAALKSYSIQIMWSTPALPAGMTLKSYVLKYKPYNDPTAKLQYETIDPNKTQHLIDGLKPGTVYHISLAGKTEHGEGIAAQVTEKTSDEIPDKPRGISLEVLGSTSIKVAWKGPKRMLDQIQYYIIKWMSRRHNSKLKNGGDNSAFSNGVGDISSSREEGTIRVDADKNNSNKQYETVLNNLTPNLYYKIEIRAVSSRGESKAYEFAVQKTTGEIPSMPINFEISQLRPIYSKNGLVYANVHMVWGPPERKHGKIIGYRIGITLIGPYSLIKEIGKTKIYRNVSSFEYSTTKDDKIGYGRRYLFEVEALNEISYGFPAQINQTIQEKKPTAHPEKFEIQASKNTVTISWQPPLVEYRNGVILGYKVRYYKMNNSKKTKKQLTVNKHTSIKITDLDEDTTYVFMLLAFNSAGDGPWSPGSSYYISMEYFPPPDNVKAVALGDSDIKVTWDYPVKANYITSLANQIVGFSIHVSLTDNEKLDDTMMMMPAVSNGLWGRSVPGTLPRLKPLLLYVLRKKYPNTYFIKVRCVLRDERATEWSSAVKVTVHKSRYPDYEIKKLVCVGMSTAISVLWSNPKVDKYIYSFEIMLVGVRKYRNFADSVQRELLTSRRVPINYDGKEKTRPNIVIDEMEPNTVYDVIITTKFNASSEISSLTKKTSCATFMAKPAKVQYPYAIPQRKKSNQVILRLYRTEEKRGVISHYYLIVGPVIETHITTNDVNINTTFLSTQRMSKTIKTRYVVAQFTPAFFKSKPFADFILGSPDPSPNFSQQDWIFLKNPTLIEKAKYRAFLRACVLPEGTENGSLDIACTSSDWSTVFSTDINQEGDVLTIALISGIVGVILLVFACIGLACFVRRSHDKVSRPLINNDPYLKQPLMMQSTGANGGTGSAAGAQHHLHNHSGSATGTLTSVGPSYATVITTAGASNRHNVALTGPSLLENGLTTCPTGSINNSPGQAANFTNSKLLLQQQRSLEMKKVANSQTPDLVQNTICIGNSQRPPIPIHRLEAHIAELKANDNFLFSQEYESIDPGQQFTWEHSNQEINRSKNRYANVIAYDHSRVVLQSINGVPGSDYINANYIDGYKRSNAYIATQGPLSNTFGDFWRMVWEQESSAIVMMTKLEERTRVKCDQYWPNKAATEGYADGAITVALTDIAELAYYTIRTFTLTANYVTNLSEASLGSNKREVKQYQFTAWPDHGVPDNPIPLLMFLSRVKAGCTHNCGPLIVHCSAGVGRTGAFIAIDAGLERLRHEMTLDIFGQVSMMRAQRNYMVQTEEQYVFVHEVLLDSVRAGCTEVTAHSIPVHVQSMLRSVSTGPVLPGAPLSSQTAIEIEFQKLSHFKVSPSAARCTSANLPINKLKNRLVNILPYEFNRVCLQPIRGCEGSDYINASFIDGYYSTRAYIATQAPLLETVEDFWRMIWEMNSTIIVMLTKLKEMGREKCHRYWPSERSSRYQYFVVDPTVEYNMPNFVLQEFKVTDARDGQSRTIRQFQFTEWPEQGVPSQAGGEPFIDFIGQVHKTKEQFGQEGPITVHCSAGVGRTGVFLALSISLEKLRKEGVIDLFQTVRMLRYQRANMIQSEEQYKFCYLALQDYITSFDNVLE